ncbi:MAG: hypothetical protein AB8G22_16695 [Saprospiraceae bacterium]
MLKPFNRYAFLLFTILLSLTVSAQTNSGSGVTDNSPYSRLGLGDLVNQNFAAANGMGNLSATLHDGLHLNILNPASYAHLQATAFEVGFYGEYASLQSGEQATNFWNGNLNYLAVGFPIKNPINKVLDRDKSPWGWGMNISLTPYSRVGYDIETDVQIDTLQTSNFFRGTGGTYKILWGNGVRYKNLSFGVNAGFIFGKISNERIVTLDNADSHFFFNELSDEFSVNGFVWNAGIQYDIILDQKETTTNAAFTGKRLIIGAYGNSTTGIETNTSQLYTRLPVPATFGIRADTITATSGVIEPGQLPAEFSFGLMYENTNKFRAGANMHYGYWSGYENANQDEVLSDSYEFSAGIEITPDILSYNNYWKKVRYRFGGFYGNDPRSFQGEQLQRYGVTLGFGLPIILPRQQTSYVNFALEAGRFGLTDSLHENYLRMTLGFTLTDNTWFFKRKFN